MLTRKPDFESDAFVSALRQHACHVTGEDELMQDDLKLKLDQAFAANAEKKRRANEQRAQIISAEEQFLKDFALVADTVIKPALTEIGELAKTNGLPYRIESSQAGKGGNSRDGRASIGIIFIEGDQDRYRPSHEYAGWIAFADTTKLKIAFHKRTMGPGKGGMAGGTGEHAVSAITQDVVHGEVAAVLTEILR